MIIKNIKEGGRTDSPVWAWSGDILMDLTKFQALKHSDMHTMVSFTKHYVLEVHHMLQLLALEIQELRASIQGAWRLPLDLRNVRRKLPCTTLVPKPS